MTKPTTSSSASADPLDVAAIRADFPILDQEVAPGRPLIYLDNAASTQRPRAVIEAIVAAYEHAYANVHRGLHTLSERSTGLYEQARQALARFIGAAHEREVIFTSGTTLGINTIARAWGDTHVQAGDEILTTVLEHHSNIVPWQQLAERQGARVQFVDIHDDGTLDLDDFRRKLTDRTRIVAFAAVSNVLGTMLPVAELTSSAHDVGAIAVVDAAQHVPHSVTDVHAWGADFVCFSGHKMLGPSGLGVLWGRSELLQEMPPFLGGGSMISQVTTEGFVPGELPAKFEAGTPPIVPAIATRAAVDYLQRIGIPAIEQHEQRLLRVCLEQMSELPAVRILGPAASQRAGIVSFVVPGLSPQDIAIFIDRQGVAIRAGHHCAMPLHQRLGVAQSCRASFYLYNTVDEVQRFVAALAAVIRRLT